MLNSTVSVSNAARWETLPKPLAVTRGDVAAVGLCLLTKAHKEHHLGQGIGWEM